MSRTRLRIVFWLIFIAFILIWFRLAYWQLGRSRFLLNLFKRQSYHQVVIEAQPGKIISQDGFILATSQKEWKIAFNPQKCPQKEEIINKYLRFQKAKNKMIAGWLTQKIKNKEIKEEMVNLDKIKQATQSAFWKKRENYFLAKVRSKRVKWLELSSLDQSFLDKLSPAARKCLFLYPLNKRKYPDKNIDGYFLGFRGLNKTGQPKGYFGLEGFYDQELRGLDGWKIQEYDALGRLVPQIFNYHKQPLDGRDLHLFLSYNFQYLADEAIKAGVKKYQAEKGTIIILDPIKMAVLAMASYPSYRPEYYSWYRGEAYLNPAVAGLYEPGSTFKTLVMALGLDLKKIKPQTICSVCSGPLVTSGGTIRTWNDKYYPNSTMTEVLVHSDNVGMAWLASQIGKEEIYKFLVRAGFGQKTGVDLEDDQVNPLKPLTQWYPINVMTAGFGQGIFLTPLKLAQLEAVIARGGEIAPPRLVKFLSDKQKNYPTKTAWHKRLFSTKATAEVVKMMVKVVNEGSAKWTRLPDLEIAGKTGTAQVAINGVYDPHKTIASFVGFWPVESPKYLILVKLDFPQVSPWGSETAAPLFFKLARKINLISQEGFSLSSTPLLDR